MHVEQQEFSVQALVEAWANASLRRNPEYQRGAAWTTPQKQALIDSVFRGYPLPPLFLHRQTGGVGLDGNASTWFEVIDGQQRLIALSEYVNSQFPTLPVDSNKLRLPNSLRAIPADWAGNTIEQLPPERAKQLRDQTIHVYVLSDIPNPDIVRDLFIRLQSGKALNRQQIRDAWPGDIGPFVQSLAGKMTHQPRVGLFRLIDRRGVKGEPDEARDEYVLDRQLCAQLMVLYIGRRDNPFVFPSVGASALDGLYHDNTQFDPHGEDAERFLALLEHTENVLRDAHAFSQRKKFRKLAVYSVFMLIQDTLRYPRAKVTRDSLRRVASRLVKVNSEFRPGGGTTSSKAIERFYEEFRRLIGEGLFIELDPDRLFSESQRHQIWTRDSGTCQVCGRPVDLEDAEFDHYPVPHRDGGRTTVDNGRLVHKRCHPRGRPVIDY